MALSVLRWGDKTTGADGRPDSPSCSLCLVARRRPAQLLAV